jgi:hypothetical protein
MPERDWIDVEIDLRDAALDPHERPSRRMLANACLGVGLEDAYYSVRECREAVTLIHSGECRGRRKLAEILANACDDFQRCIFYALAGRDVVLILDDLAWLEGLLKVRGDVAGSALPTGGQLRRNTHHGHNHSSQSQSRRRKTAPQTAQGSCETPLIRWSVQEIRHIACRPGQRDIKPAHFIAWSLWRRAHQAAAQHAHFKINRQL